MLDKKDALAARRWFREQLTTLAAQYPHLTSPDAQDRLATHLTTEETTPCPAHPPATRADVPPASSTDSANPREA